MKKQGFTLVEIMIVVAIIGLLTAIAIPAFLQYRADTRAGLCQNNLRLIHHAKGVVAIKENIASGGVIDAADVILYITGGAMPVCPDGVGAYVINVDGVDPACPNVGAFPTHVLQ